MKTFLSQRGDEVQSTLQPAAWYRDGAQFWDPSQGPELGTSLVTQS
jgi:hypothetical protein